MKKLMLFLWAILMTGVCQAGPVKVLKTEYAGLDIDQDGAYVTVNVKLQVTNIGEEQCSCVALLNNRFWDGDNMTIDELAELSQMICEGDVDLNAVSGSKIVTVQIDVPLDANSLTGDGKTFYLKAFVVDFDKNAVVAEGQMINFVPNPQDAMAKKQQDINQQVIKMATQNMGPSQGDSTSKTTQVKVSCSVCGGTGKSWDVNGQITCRYCDGKGYTTKTKKVSGEQNVFDILAPVLE